MSGRSQRDLDKLGAERMAIRDRYERVFGSAEGRVVLVDILEMAGLVDDGLIEPAGPGADTAIAVAYGRLCLAHAIARKANMQPQEIYAEAAARLRQQAGLEDDPFTQGDDDERQRRAE